MIHRETFRVRMDKVDALGVAFFARYWDWYEDCFEGFVARASGQTWKQFVDGGRGLPYVHCEIDYHRPVVLSDEVTVELRLVRTGTRSVHFTARFLAADGSQVATANSVHVPVRADGRATEIPDWLRKAADESGSTPDRGR